MVRVAQLFSFPVLCVLFSLSFFDVLYPLLPVSQDYPCLIVPSVLSNIYSRVYDYTTQGSNRTIGFECHWKLVERWVWKTKLAFCIEYKGLVDQKSINGLFNLQEGWYFQNTVLTLYYRPQLGFPYYNLKNISNTWKYTTPLCVLSPAKQTCSVVLTAGILFSIDLQRGFDSWQSIFYRPVAWF